MTAHRVTFPTSYTLTPYRLVTLRRRRGYAIMDERSGLIACTRPRAITGRLVPAMEPDARRALRIAAGIIEMEPAT